MGTLEIDEWAKHLLNFTKNLKEVHFEEDEFVLQNLNISENLKSMNQQ